jgi:hypothetical protein
MGQLGQTLGLGGGQGPQQIAPMAGDPSSMPFLNLPAFGTPDVDPETAGTMYQAVGTSAMPNWQPTHRNILGKLADALSGTDTYEKRMQDRDMQSAMKGFADDPLAAIQRIAEIPGHAADAYGMYDKYVDNKNQTEVQTRQDRLADLRMDDYVYQRSASILSSANEQTWPRVRQIAIDAAKRRGVALDIPEQYDPTFAESMFNGAIKPKDIMTNTTRERGQDMRKEVQERAQDLSHGDRVAAEAGRDSRAGIMEEGRNKRAAAQQQGLNARADKRSVARPAKVPDHIISTKYGSAKVFNNGMNMSVKAGTNSNGKDRYAIYERKGENQWHLTGYK